MVTEIQQGLPVKQDYWLHRVAGDIQQGYWFRELLVPPPPPPPPPPPSIVGYREICCTHPYGKKPASDPGLTTGSLVTENCRFRSAAGYREICCSHPDCPGTSFKSSADNIFTGYRGFPVTEY